METVGERIKQIMQEKEITCRQVAACTGISKSTINRYTKDGEDSIPQDKITMIARALGVTPAYLMGWECGEEMTIYQRIKSCRENLGMSQQELAEKVGYKTASAINKIELGLRGINQSKISTFAQALNTTPSYLMGWEEDTRSFSQRMCSDMETVGERIKYQMEKKGLSFSDLSRLTGYSRSVVFRYANDMNEKVPISRVEKIARALGVTPVYLMGLEPEDVPALRFDNVFAISPHRFPLLGEIACGDPILAVQQADEYVEVGADIRADFCLQAHGNSMIGAGINDGDYVFIRAQPLVDDGDIAAVVIDDTATLKRVTFLRDRQMIILKAENPKYKDLVYADSELNEVRILGKAVSVLSKI